MTNELQKPFPWPEEIPITYAKEVKLIGQLDPTYEWIMCDESELPSPLSEFATQVRDKVIRKCGHEDLLRLAEEFIHDYNDYMFQQYGHYLAKERVCTDPYNWRTAHWMEWAAWYTLSYEGMQFHWGFSEKDFCYERIAGILIPWENMSLQWKYLQEYIKENYTATVELTMSLWLICHIFMRRYLHRLKRPIADKEGIHEETTTALA